MSKRWLAAAGAAGPRGEGGTSGRGAGPDGGPVSPAARWSMASVAPASSAWMAAMDRPSA
ncbi:hypothetical protein [Microbispora sp. GKU 823]|uniref:hypothetical protein n=1 Tax=Microbispora sp. GKU 823 TaxID=1652100 RepID=UPI002117A3E5|nr:hypothetical protein [Microbispora sp. GKU 823]